MGILDIFWIYLILTTIQPVIIQKWSEASRLLLPHKLGSSRGSRVIALLPRQETMRLLGFPIFRHINIEDSENALRAIKVADKSAPIGLITHRLGGLAPAARQIAYAPRRHSAQASAIVSHYAMSE
jgi:ClpP class serine protease